MRTEETPEAERLKEVRTLETAMATRLAKRAALATAVEAIRKRYVVLEFLHPLYAWDGRYSRSRGRVAKLGDFVLPSDRAGEPFDYDERGWVHNETFWFWWYLVEGQQIVCSKPQYTVMPEDLVKDGLPCQRLWRDIYRLSLELGLAGDQGGGITLSANDLDADSLGELEKQTAAGVEGDEGGMFPKARWMKLFMGYDRFCRLYPEAVEIAPAWFHLTNYILFNVPITRLPTFLAVYDKTFSLGRLSFVNPSPYLGLSDETRTWIADSVASFPVKLKEAAMDKSAVKLKRDVLWWLGHNVGDGAGGGTLSYGEIGRVSCVYRSTVQSAIQAFEDKLNKGITPDLLGTILRTATHLKLDVNLVYNHLADKGVVPHRNREIDDFDDLYRLI